MTFEQNWTDLAGNSWKKDLYDILLRNAFTIFEMICIELPRLALTCKDAKRLGITTFRINWNKSLQMVQCCVFENHWSLFYVSNWYFSRFPGRCWECCYNLALLAHIYHIWELSNEVLYNSVPRGIKKITSQSWKFYFH